MSIRLTGRIYPSGGIKVRGIENITYTTWNTSSTWNNATSDPVYSNGDLTVALPGGVFSSGAGTATSVASFNTGLRYVEITLNSRQSTLNPGFGLVTADRTTTTSLAMTHIRYWYGGGTPAYYVNGIGTTYGSFWNVGDVIGMLINFDTGSSTFFRNGVSQGSAFTVPTNALGYRVFARSAGTGYGATITANFGATPFAYPQSGATGWFV